MGRMSQKPRTFVETRDLLERELASVSRQPDVNLPPPRKPRPAPAPMAAAVPQTQPTYAIVPVPEERRRGKTPAKRDNSWRNMIAVLFSSGVILLTGYSFLHFRATGKTGAPPQDANYN